MPEEATKSNWRKITGLTILVLLPAALCLFFLMFVFLVISQFVKFGFTPESIGITADFVLRLKDNPLYLFDAYANWWQIFMIALRYNNMSFAVFIPFLAPLMVISITLIVFFKSEYSFNLWYRLHNHFAKYDDLKKMGLFEGYLMALGRFEDKIIRLSKTYSVFCCGGPGTGKTAGVAIPSILESDGASIVAVDIKGKLKKYTAAYRKQIGTIFLFDWMQADCPEKNEYWPRWNPLSQRNMPQKGRDRDNYINFLAQYILAPDSQEKDNYWERLAITALDGLLLFFIHKIEQATANDYFLSVILEKGRIGIEDKDILLSYYAMMPYEYSREAIKNLEKGKLNIDNYLPVGSWDGIPESWRGKEASLAMLGDCLVERYLVEKNEEENAEKDDWKGILEAFLAESTFFGYHKKADLVLQQLSYLSKKQKNIIFPMILKPFTVFRNTSIRERTSSSDFYINQARGIRNENHEWEPVTIYNTASSIPARFITRLFVDILINAHLTDVNKGGPYPLLMVMDDLAEMPRFLSLQEGLTHGLAMQMSFLLSVDHLKKMEEIYTTAGLEEIISNTTYKLMFAEDNLHLSHNFLTLAEFGTKSVQIPQVDAGAFMKVKRGLNDASYYLKIARDLTNRNKSEIVKKGYFLLLAEGYYHLPAKLKSLYYYKNEFLKEKAELPETFSMDDDVVRRRDVQDIEVPLLKDVLQEVGIMVTNEDDIDRQVEKKYASALEEISTASDKTSALADDISAKWKSRTQDSKEEKINKKEEDWWLEEENFAVTGKDNINPFVRKDK